MDHVTLSHGNSQAVARDHVSRATARSAGSSATARSGVIASSDYESLRNKPSIEEVELVGNKELGDFGMGTASYYDISMLFV